MVHGYGDLAGWQPGGDHRPVQPARHEQFPADLDVRHVVLVEHHVRTLLGPGTVADAGVDLVQQRTPQRAGNSSQVVVAATAGWAVRQPS